jgi:RsiW-degrading membrane proteinase PrsW (M82 family)
MLENPILLLGISLIAAGIPAFVWLYILFNKNSKSKWIIAIIFGLGCLTAPFLLGVQFAWEKFPQFNLASFIETTVTTQSTRYVLLFVLFGAMEEIVKHYVICSVDKRTILIKTIGDSIRYSLAAALGFSFAENVYYLYQFWPQISIGELAGMYIFRSIFTACAHMIFSGIFGYYYGIGKFSIDITKQQQLIGESSRATRSIARIFNISLSHAYQQEMVLKGLSLAIILHVIYNYLLQFNIIIPIIIFVVIGYLYLQYLLNRKAGHLILATDISTKQRSTIAKKDEDIVIELLGLWFKEKRYVDVIHICERLLERDPDNNVVKLFKAQAADKMSDKDVYKNILGTILKDKNNPDLLSKYMEQKDKKIKTTSITTQSAPQSKANLHAETNEDKTYNIQI